jgi:HSP20 family protein
MTTLKQNPFLFGNLMDDFFPAPSAYYPPVNIIEKEQGFNIELKVPGIEKEAINIQIEKGLLIISHQQSEHKDPKVEKLIKREFSIKSFKRTFSLDEKINTQAIDAKMENGILTLSLPLKEESVEPKKTISIK